MDEIKDLFKPIPLEIEEKRIEGMPEVKTAKYFSLDEAVSYLEVTKRQVYRYIKAGKLKPHYRKVKGRRRLYLYSKQVIELYPTIRKRATDQDDALEGFLLLGELIASGICNRL